MRLPWLIVIGLIAPALADTTLLDRGRALEQQGKHAEAIAAYQAYLKTAPDDATANAELGFAALQAKDLKTAEAATRHAIAHAPADTAARIRGAALFNLGMIQEAQLAPRDAVVSYQESLASRPSRAVRERLQKLDAAVAATVDPLAPTRLVGPFQDLNDACRDWMVRHEEPADQTWGDNGSCRSLDMIKIGGPAKLAAPYVDLVAFQMIDRSSLELGVKTSEGWFVFDYEGKGHRGQMHCGSQFTVTQRGVVKKLLRVDYHSTGSCFHRSESWGWDERGTIVVGVGASQRPSSPPAIITAQIEFDDSDNRKRVNKTEAAVTPTFNADGTLDLAGKVYHRFPIGPEDLDGENLLGHHILAFP